MRFSPYFLSFFILAVAPAAQAQTPFTVAAYYTGGPAAADSIAADKLTHVIYSFLYLKSSRLHATAKDSATIQRLVALKKKAPHLKVLLSLGGWGGCATCSEVFAQAQNRREFARSVKELCTYFNADGIDLDWEYPAVPGSPDQRYMPEDKANFTDLVDELRQALGPRREISFAAASFDRFLNESIDWEKVMKKVDRVHLMTYDLVGSGSDTTGHHTPLYSTGKQKPSTDYAVQELLKRGVPSQKIVIGAAFYARVWKGVEEGGNGLYGAGTFTKAVPYRSFANQLSARNGFALYWDEEAKAAYAYNRTTKEYATFDDARSVALKTQYAKTQNLGGIMFWELSQDVRTDGLLQAIHQASGKNNAAPSGKNR